MDSASSFPEKHPLRVLFQTLADRALAQSSLPDHDLMAYLSDLLLDFVRTDHLYSLRDEQGRPIVYLVDLLERASQLPPRRRKNCYKWIGDHTLFILGMFPESLNRRAIPTSYYSDAGRRCYLAASHLEGDSKAITVYRKLAEKYERCVLSLNWVREYATDPFYQYMFREFGLS